MKVAVSWDCATKLTTWFKTWQRLEHISLKKKYRRGTVVRAYNPSTLGGRGGWIMRSRDWDHPGQHGETLSLLKIQKISWTWWHAPVVSATQEAEAGKLLEPRRRRLQWAEIMPLHFSLGNNRETPSQKKKRKKKRDRICYRLNVCLKVHVES